MRRVWLDQCGEFATEEASSHFPFRSLLVCKVMYAFPKREEERGKGVLYVDKRFFHPKQQATEPPEDRALYGTYVPPTTHAMEVEDYKDR